MNDNGYLLEYSTRLAYSIPGFSNEQELYWSRITRIIFLETLSENQILHVVSQAAGAPFLKNESAIKEGALKLSEDQRATTFALLNLIREHAEERDTIKAKSIDGFIRHNTTLTGADDAEAITATTTTLREKIQTYENRPVIKIPLSLWPLSIDYALRWFALIGAGAGSAVALNMYIVIITIVLTLAWRRQQRKKQKVLFSEFGGTQDFRIRYEVSALQYTILAFFTGSSAFICYLILPDGGGSFFITIGLTFCYFLYIRLFPLGNLDESNLSQQISESNKQRRNFSPDENDEAIVSTESQLTAITGRLDAYVLESALFGALAFSGFLQVISEELVGFAQLEKFVDQVSHASSAFLFSEWDDFAAASGQLETTRNLLCLISIETLICSVFFLAVIASRLRFSNVADRVREAINQANAYNLKEEAALENANGQNSERVQALNEKVNTFLASASRAMENVHPIMGYMEYFRNAGILTFLLLLVSSGLFISNTLALAFIFLGLGTLIYFNRERIALAARKGYLRFRLLMSIRGKTIPLVIVGFLAFVFLLRTVFGVMPTDGLLTLGFLLLSFYGFSWIVFVPHHDPTYGDVMRSGKDEWQDGRWILIRNILGFSLLSVGIGYVFKKLSLSGADEMLMLGLTIFSITYILSGYYLAKKRWMGILAAWLTATGLIGIMFSALNLLGAKDMILVGEVMQIIIIVLLIFFRRYFHIFFIKTFIFIFVINTLNLSGLSNRVSLAYEHATLSPTELNKIVTLYDGFAVDDPRGEYLHDGTAPDIQAMMKGVEAQNEYMKIYGHRFGYTSVYKHFVTEGTWYIFIKLQVTPVDTTALTSILPVARQLTTFDSLFNYSTGHNDNSFKFEPYVLYQLGRKQEAVNLLRNVVNSNAADKQKEKARALIVAVESNTLSME